MAHRRRGRRLMDAVPVSMPLRLDGGAQVDYAAFLQSRLAQQTKPLAAYLLTSADGLVPAQQVWLKRAGPAHGRWGYRALAALALVLRQPALRPVPSPGGGAGLALEARRLAALRALGLRVPTVLAQHEDGLLLHHLGRAGAPTKSLADELHHAVLDEPSQVLPLWRQGLDAIGLVHEAGACLSQAFARNLVRCPDGVVGYVDFEDDPASALPLPLCQLRDLLCYAHSSALYLHTAGVLPQARLHWATWSAQRPSALQALLQRSSQQLRWLRQLPTDRRFGRDVQRTRMAYALIATGA